MVPLRPPSMRPPSVRPPSMRPSVPPPDEQASWITKFGSMTAAGAFAAAIAALPAAMRAPSADADVDRIGAWLALTGVAVLPCVVLVGIFRGAYVGLRAYGGDGAMPRAAGLATWLAMILLGFTGYGAALRATTHHHALAGATFALGGLVVALGSALVARRVASLLARATEDAQKVLTVAIYFGLFGCIGVVASRLGHDEGAPVVDALALLLAVVFAGQPNFIAKKALAIAGPPAAAVFLALGVATLRSSAVLETALVKVSPIFSYGVQLFGGH